MILIIKKENKKPQQTYFFPWKPRLKCLCVRWEDGTCELYKPLPKNYTDTLVHTSISDTAWRFGIKPQLHFESQARQTYISQCKRQWCTRRKWQLRTLDMKAWVAKRWTSRAHPASQISPQRALLYLCMPLFLSAVILQSFLSHHDKWEWHILKTNP